MEDWEYSDFNCPKCGETLRCRDCEDCGGEGTIDDLYEQDPMWYDEDEWEYCSHCNGKGCFFWCGNEKCDATEKQIRRAIKEQSAQSISDFDFSPPEPLSTEADTTENKGRVVDESKVRNATS